MRRCLILITLLLPLPSHAGAWLQPEGKGLWLVQATHFSSAEFYDRDHALQPQDTFTKYELQPYMEYGLTKNWTVGGSLYLNRIDQAEANNWGVANPEFWARTKLWQTDAEMISLQPLIKLPSFYNDSNAVRGGSKSLDIELSVLVGMPMPLISERDYFDIRAGYRWRSRGRAPQLHADASLGFQMTDDWQLITSYREIIAQKLSDSFREDGEQDYHLRKIELTNLYALDEIRFIQATAYAHADGAMVGAGQGFSIGYGERF
jgi:hypothetical protein